MLFAFPFPSPYLTSYIASLKEARRGASRCNEKMKKHSNSRNYSLFPSSALASVSVKSSTSIFRPSAETAQSR